MKIAGRRSDGALYLLVGAGHAVILRGTRVSPTLDESVIEAMGPWTPSPDDASLKARREVQRALDLARVSTLDFFALDKDEHGYGSYPKDEASPAADASAKPAGMPSAKPAGMPSAKPAADASAKPADDYYAERERDNARMKRENAVAKYHRLKRAGQLARAKAHKAEHGLSDADVDAINLFRKTTTMVLDGEDKDKDEKATPVSDIAEVAQDGNATIPTEEVLNLPPNPFVPVDDRKERREKMRGKLAARVTSQGKVGDLLGDEDVTDDDLFEMAKSLDNGHRFRALLSSTAHAKHISLAGGEHPFTYCKEVVIPSMEEEGKAPDDPDAFCAWWKNEGPGSE